MELIYEGGGRGIFHAIDAEDVKTVMKHASVAIATDGFGPTFGEASPHPRNYGTFARVLGYYSREEGVLTLPEAIRKMTSLPARRMGLTDRGILATGNVADIVVFNADTVIDKATFAKPHQYAEGFSNVFVNGIAVIKDGKRTSDLPGKMLKGPGYKSPN
jgi:dihydroorotase/N-acyl-D-amino-acid deacylase